VWAGAYGVLIWFNMAAYEKHRLENYSCGVFLGGGYSPWTKENLEEGSI
jgi:hypothetical protein